LNRVLITGASGFVGCHLITALETMECPTVTIGRNETGERFWDMSAPPDPAALTGVDTIFHLAGRAHALSDARQDEGEYFRINTEGTRQLLEAAKNSGVQRFVLFSSVKAAGEGGFECLDETVPCHPKTPYGASKLAAEQLVLEGGYIPEPVVLRLSMVYGPSEKGNLPRMIRAVEKGRFPPLPEVGNKRSMVHVDDVVRAAMLAARQPEAIGQTYIVTDGTPYSTRQIYEWICERVGKTPPAGCIPLSLLRLLARMGDGIGLLRGRRFVFDSDALDKLTGSACYSSRKIERELGFSAFYHLHDSLPEIIRFLEGRKV